MQREDLLWIGLGIMVLGLVLTVFFAARARTRGRHAAQRPRIFGRRRPHRNDFRPEGTVLDEPLKRAAIIINPTKFADVDEVRRQIVARCLEAGWGEPLIMLTTVVDPGTGQAHQAVDQGVNLVCPLGGDGTVRAVAAALAGSEVPMGLLPGGTGNLLARNLDLPIDSIDSALKVALTGQNKRIDVGRLRLEPLEEQQTAADHIFLVMAGLGFDAAIMAGAPDGLKARVGPAAYVVSGTRAALQGTGFRVKVQVDDVPAFSRRTRTVVVGNCGRLLGGLVLMPDALVDDGKLDAILISPRGVVGWAAVAARLATRQRKGHSIVDHYTTSEISIQAESTQDVQIDGDVIGQARSLVATVDHLALTVRVPTPS